MLQYIAHHHAPVASNETATRLVTGAPKARWLVFVVVWNVVLYTITVLDQSELKGNSSGTGSHPISKIIPIGCDIPVSNSMKSSYPR
ncbi:hypothetical protein PAXRUDRAFT_825168 [Paxillus rubicundulus Ve08.2h10]|uniref:Uncharacterized protein n=1 Tax=Paxillus rubicundulus Ve08.2h10 TaxID=930991 RepID=A0A0D0E6P1_9AGAM|nr:hypothetical protein PAXRUDRAFT_825168 [Paxillus rubicundulus Ve08.2h10]